MNSSVEEFKKIAKLNNIETKELNDIKEELKEIGYGFEDHFSNGSISVVKALCANKKEANAIIDVSDNEKLSSVLDTERLIIMIDRNKIFEDMYKAYTEAKKQCDSNYMIFVSQESKTADIEKQLISGVQGAKRLEFVIYDEQERF